MSIGIVSDDEFDKELTRIHKPTSIIVEMPAKGRGEGNKEVPESLRKIIGEESKINGRKAGLELAKRFNISPSSVSAYANGSTSTKSYHEPDKELREHINDSKSRIVTKAKNRLIQALGQITPEKLAEAKLKDVSTVAMHMSAIVKNMEPDLPAPESNSPQFILYAPQFSKEERYETIIVNDTF